MNEKQKQQLKYDVITKELKNHEEFLNEAKRQKSLIPFYEERIAELKKWIKEETSICENCNGLGRVRYDGNNEDCNHCEGAGIQKHPPLHSKFD